jgi:mono/diheme cytochrome c family protein
MIKQILIGLGALAVLALGGYGIFIYVQSHPTQAAIAKTQSLNDTDAKLGSDQLGAHLYLTACASCHYVATSGYNDDRADLAGNDAVTGDDPAKLINIILKGKGSEMPAFGRGLSDATIAKIAAYLRATRTQSQPWTDLENKVAVVRAKGNTKSGATQP